MKALRINQCVQRRSAASVVEMIESLRSLKGDDDAEEGSAISVVQDTINEGIDSAEDKSAFLAQVSGFSGSVDGIAEEGEGDDEYAEVNHCKHWSQRR